MTDLSKLMHACDECDKRVDEARSKREAAQLALDNYVQQEAIVTAEALGLHRALMLVTPQHGTAEQPAPAQETKPKEKAPLDQCIAAIRQEFRYTIGSDRDVTEALKTLGHKFNIRTVRNALAKIETESRASAQPLSDADRKDTGSPSDATPNSGGAGTITDEFPDIPANLRRSPNRMCTECGKYPADHPSKLCPGCEAYREHTAA